MPAFALFMMGGMLTLVTSMVGRVLLALGLSYVTYTGFEMLSDRVLGDIKGYMNALPVEVASFLGYLWVDKAIAMIFSAYLVAMGIKALGNSSITRLVFGGGGG